MFPTNEHKLMTMTTHNQYSVKTAHMVWMLWNVCTQPDAHATATTCRDLQDRAPLKGVKDQKNITGIKKITPRNLYPHQPLNAPLSPQLRANFSHGKLRC